MNPLYNSQRIAAFTLMELMISIALLGMVMTIVTMSLDTGNRFNDRFSRQTDINNRANDILNKLAMQLRLAADGQKSASGNDIALELPGPYPIGFTPKDPANATKVKAYHYAVSTGLGGAAEGFLEQFEPFKRMIIHDASVVPGRLLLQTRDNSGNLNPVEILSEEVAENGFNLSRVGNTLQMSVTLRSQTRVEEEIIYTALAQTLFLRSTLSKSSGLSSDTFVPNTDDADAVPVSYTTGAPSIMFGEMLTKVGTNQWQVTLFITAGIGRKVDPKSIVVTLGNGDNTISEVVDEGGTVSVGLMTATRTTYPPPDQWPSRNGTYSVTLTGTINGTVRVTASAATTDGEKYEIYKNY